MIDRIIFILGVLSASNLAVIGLFVSLAMLKKRHYPDSTPALSIIVPAHNEESKIMVCLNSIAMAAHGRNNIEVICVDDGSTDNTGRIMMDFIHKYQNKIAGTYIRRDTVGKAHALNAGVRASHHELVFTLDADTTIDSSFLNRITSPFSDPSVGYTFGTLAINPAHQKGWLTHYQALEYSFITLLLRSSTILFGYPIWFCGAVVCYRRQALIEMGLFSADSLTEDVDISYMLYHKGYKAVFLPDIVAYTEPMNTIRELANQRMRWNYGAIQNTIKHSKLFTIKALILCYLLFSTMLWLLNSLVMLPTFLTTLTSLMLHDPVESVRYFFMSGTMTGTLQTLATLGAHSVNNIYDLIGVMLFTLFTISTLSTQRNWRWQTLPTLFTYFSYICFLQACCVLSFVKYRGKLSVGFVRS